MLREAAMLTLSCVLFVQMGLSDAMQETIRVRLRILSCPKCCTFWSVLVLTLVRGNGIVDSVAVSFASSYLALWLSLLYDYVATIYNKAYESITETTDPEKGSGLPESGNTDAVS